MHNRLQPPRSQPLQPLRLTTPIRVTRQPHIPSVIHFHPPPHRPPTPSVAFPPKIQCHQSTCPSAASLYRECRAARPPSATVRLEPPLCQPKVPQEPVLSLSKRFRLLFPPKSSAPSESLPKRTRHPGQSRRIQPRRQLHSSKHSIPSGMFPQSWIHQDRCEWAAT